ncbi:hypothetical protein CFC21_008640 [Triticum aestivum]|uniref:DUF7086 domain-containing protein n=2 Tax=Triticum aestivum TaxID=4565 RepID=A0A3B5Z316_WHEAT|nr:uncharacterized protein LOC123097560 [Triticum aestivum]KAF6991565.1 hypothetical protein CFC21_008640 [Triticum aestivum]
MGKVVDSAGSSSGQKRKSDGHEDSVVPDDPNLRLSLGCIYSSVSTQCTTATTPAAVNLLLAHLPVPAAGVAIATGVQIGASPTAVAASSSRILAASASIPFMAKQPPTTSLVPPIKPDVVVPLGSPVACSAQPPSTRRRITNGVLPQPQPPSSKTGSVSQASTNGTPPAIPPFPWATNRAAIHHPISYLLDQGITTVEGEVKCKRCDVLKTVSYNIAVKFKEVRDFVTRNIHDMDDRAPAAWMTPAVPDCDGCGLRNSLRPVIALEKERINWVFLLLGQTLGLCTLEQLKYFCARTGQHRTGAKDRVLYSTYMELCSQLCPERLFNLTAERQKRGQQYS